jgi:1-deoxy-D-xylulose-5-phosphate reductoisomerase
VKRIAVLGSTGSIGTQTLDIVRQHPDRLRVTGLVANTNGQALLAQSQEFKCDRIVLMDEPSAAAAGVPGGMAAVEDLVSSPDVDLVVIAVAGVIGLVPTLAAIRARKEIALASKEVLVAAGEIVMPLVREYGIVLTPIDSEHSAVFQCVQGYRPAQVKSVTLTASGGPFRGKSQAELEAVTVEQALNHPTWSMGGKITIDSATLMNKGLEVIEAHWLFGLDIDDVHVVVHPQSIVHSFVEFQDTSVLAQCGWPDMRLPIQYALLYPERTPNQLKPWHPAASPTLTFERPDYATFRCPEIARKSAKTGRTAPCAMNAANEEAANAFLAGHCGFLQIADVVEETVSLHTPVDARLDSLLATDCWARETVRRLLQLE